MQRVCFGWLAWEMTGSPFWLGAIATAEFLPVLLVSPLVGDTLDRHDKRRIIVFSELLAAASLSAILLLFLLGVLTVPLLFLFAFAVGTAMAISHPAQLAWYPHLLQDRSHISSAANIYILVLNLARFVGAGLAGVVISLLGIAAALALTVAGYLIFVAVLAVLPKQDRARAATASGGALKSAAEGLRYTFSHPLIGGILVLTAATSAGGRGLPDLAPAITEIQLAMPTNWFTTLVAATGLGSVVAGLWNLVRRDQSVAASVRLTVRFSLAMALCMAVLAMTTNFVLAVGFFAALGFSITITAVQSQHVIQSTVDDTMRGRVNALYFLTFRGGTAFGALWMGAAASGLGLSATTLLGAFACLLGWLRYRSLRLAVSPAPA
jgi:predicted MFS family arabinose efflux permease